jgi:hypothetical protein
MERLKARIAEHMPKILARAEWQPDAYGFHGMTPKDTPELPFVAGMPMRTVETFIRQWFKENDIDLMCVRCRDCIAGDGEPVVDLVLSPEALEAYQRRHRPSLMISGQGAQLLEVGMQLEGQAMPETPRQQEGHAAYVQANRKALLSSGDPLEPGNFGARTI